ncbi:hypothetical protein EV385_5133 [Krasilnikovia cinnamomea]|uniref:Uncharacterized protein n=1 Tax=Krasilnikovia cinnamomea TaxID=349313 RepID=A0A4Q7ZQ51_9ACTN|nr:hypothetical protein [Krasilnikovia cinnamomea]RZU53232.1 hypothetical protein EV385_5133 [Krasilnikovia cinnamomea]
MTIAASAGPAGFGTGGRVNEGIVEAYRHVETGTKVGNVVITADNADGKS